MRDLHDQHGREWLDTKLGYGCDGPYEGVLVSYELEIRLQAEDGTVAED